MWLFIKSNYVQPIPMNARQYQSTTVGRIFLKNETAHREVSYPNVSNLKDKLNADFDVLWSSVLKG